MKVLSINTYAGSLLLAAKQAKLEVVASLEDSGCRVGMQALNFPKLKIIPEVPWPDAWDDSPWDQTLVIAHPPCAAFSLQNKHKDRRGENTDAFACHVRVINYALANGCAALAIESVPGAVAARETYKTMAAEFGYSAYFILQNACSFGVPQWRPRFWAIFLPVEKGDLFISFTPKYVPLGDVVTGEGTTASGTGSAVVAATPAIQLREESWRGNIIDILRKRDGLPASYNDHLVRETYGLQGFFKSSMPRFMDPRGFAPVIVKETWLWMNGKEFTREDFCAVMGFPRTYKFGTTAHDSFRHALSQGICPPVGAWILQQMRNNATKTFKNNTHFIAPGELLDLQPKKAEALAAIAQRRLV